MADNENTAETPSNFLKDFISEDLKSGRTGGKVVTRFPPEPNGYLHIGHTKAFCINFGLAREFKGRCNLRMDDTNPAKEEKEYIDGIKADVRWLGFEWGEHEYHASDYFEQLYAWARLLIRNDKAFVCDLSGEEVSSTRGTLTEPGKESPFRNRSVEENLDLFERMKNGEFPDGLRTLRAKISMAAPNINLRDPVMYRIKRDEHPRTGRKWCIYPMYDYAHGQSDWIEGVTHSLCSLEYEDHRPLYDWYLEQIASLGGAPANVPYHPVQREFARLNMTYTLMSKRLLLKLVNEKIVAGWDDPRMPTLRAMRRRGYTPEAVLNFVERIGVAKRDSTVDIQLLEYCVREDLNKKAQRAMGVLRPLKLVIDNYPEGQEETLDAINNPEDPSKGTRKVPFSKVLYIEQEDFKEDPPKDFYRLAPGREVRLRAAYFVKCVSVTKDASGNVTEVHCTYDPATRGGDAPDKRKVKATLHWVSAAHAVEAEVRLFDYLFNTPEPGSAEDFKTVLNPKSLETLTGCKLEPMLGRAKAGERFQFERMGYFCVDTTDSVEGRPVFNRTVTLKDAWAKVEKKGQPRKA